MWLTQKLTLFTFLRIPPALKNPVEPTRIFSSCAGLSQNGSGPFSIIFHCHLAKIIISSHSFVDTARRLVLIWTLQSSSTKVVVKESRVMLQRSPLFERYCRLSKDHIATSTALLPYALHTLSSAHVGIDIKATLFCDWYSSSYLMEWFRI